MMLTRLAPLAFALCDERAAELCEQDEDVDLVEVVGDGEIRVVVHAVAPVLSLPLDCRGDEVFILVPDVEVSDGGEEDGTADRENK